MVAKEKKKLSEESRKKSRDKEAKRATNINKAYDTLLKSIPYLSAEEQKTASKIKTLRLAQKYIGHLNQVLNGEWNIDTNRPLEVPDFRSVATNEIRIRNTYRERAHLLEMSPEQVERIEAREKREKEERRRGREGNRTTVDMTGGQTGTQGGEEGYQTMDYYPYMSSPSMSSTPSVSPPFHMPYPSSFNPSFNYWNHPGFFNY